MSHKNEQLLGPETRAKRVIRVILKIVATVVAFYAAMAIVDFGIRPFLPEGTPGLPLFGVVLALVATRVIWAEEYDRAQWKRNPQGQLAKGTYRGREGLRARTAAAGRKALLNTNCTAEALNEVTRARLERIVAPAE